MHLVLFLALVCTFGETGSAQEKSEGKNAKAVPPVLVANSEAKTESEMKPYTDKIRHSKAKFEMVPIPGGKFTMGSPADESEREEDPAARKESAERAGMPAKEEGGGPKHGAGNQPPRGRESTAETSASGKCDVVLMSM